MLTGPKRLIPQFNQKHKKVTCENEDDGVFFLDCLKNPSYDGRLEEFILKDFLSQKKNK